MALLQVPLSLTYLQSLSDFENVTCVGRSFPTCRRCKTKFDVAKDEVFIAAIKKLQSLSRSGLAQCGAGLIDTLQQVAQGFSCMNRHRQYSTQERKIPYYWLALDVFPHFLDCMGLLGPIEGHCTPEKEAAIELAVSQLTAEKLWLLHQSITQLGYNGSIRWWRADRNGATAKQFRKIIADKIQQDSGDRNKIQEHDQARKRWDEWHRPLSATQREEWRCLRENSIAQAAIYKQESPSPSWNDELSSDESEDLSPRSFISPKQRFSQSHSATSDTNIDLESSSPAWWRRPRKPSQLSAARHLDTPTPTTEHRRNSKPSPKTPISSSSRQSPLNPARTHVESSRRRISRRASASASAYWQSQASPSESFRARENAKGSNLSDGESEAEHERQMIAYAISENRVSESLNNQDSMNSGSTEFDMFRANDQEAWTLSKTINEVFKLMRQPLNDTDETTNGHVYAFSAVDYPGYIKIGCTKREVQGHGIEERKSRIEKCVGCELMLFSQLDLFAVSNYKRVEKLIHKALQPYQRTFKCNKAGCHEGHDEWFKISQDKAIATLGRWKGWMARKPYSNRKLRRTESLRIWLHSESKRISQLISTQPAENGPERDDRYWDELMRYPCWRIELHDYFLQERPAMNNTRSRWVSLKENWHFNFIIYAFSFMFSCLMFLFTGFMSVSMFGLVNCVVFGSMGVLYAA